MNKLRWILNMNTKTIAPITERLNSNQ
jgi:hypothetical protein